MAKRKGGPQSQLAVGMYALNQRRVGVWIPFLEERVAQLRSRIAEKRGKGAA